MCVQPQLPQPPHQPHSPLHCNGQAGGKGGGHTLFLKSFPFLVSLNPHFLMTQVTATLGDQLRYLSLAQSPALTEDALQSISTCKRLEVLDLQGTGLQVKERVTAMLNFLLLISTVFPGRRSCLAVGSLATTAPVDLSHLPSLPPTSAPLPPYPCHPDLPTLPPRHLPFRRAGRREKTTIHQFSFR